MNKLLIAALGALLLVGVGCQKDKNGMDDNNSTMKAQTDVCTMCPGVQKATADGRCEGCGMKVSQAQ